MAFEGRSIHEYRRGKFAKFIEEIYRDWIIPDIVKQVTKGKKFLASITSEELQYVSDSMVECEVEKAKKEYVPNNFGQAMTPEMEVMYAEQVKASLKKMGGKYLLEILKDEFKGIEVRMGINVASKQKDLLGLSDKILSIFQFVFANPQAFQQAMQIPALARSFQDILEYGGLSSVDFSTLMNTPAPMLQAPQQTQQPQPMMLNQPA